MTNTNNSDSMIINDNISEIRIADAAIPFFGSSEQELEAQLDQIRQYKKVKEVHKYEIWKSKNGKWVSTYRDVNGKRHKLEYKDKPKLIRRLAEVYAEMECKKRFVDIYNEWYAERVDTGEVTQATLDRMECDWNRFIVRYGWDEKLLIEVKAGDLEAFIKKVVFSEDLSHKGYAHFKAILYEILRRGHRDGQTEISPRVFFDDLGKIKTRRVVRKDEEQVFTDEELDLLLPYLREHPDTLNRAILLDFLTGLRCGELCALKKSDLNGRYLHVCRTETKTKGAGKDGGSTCVVDRTKTETGDRMVYLSDEAVGIVTQLLVDPAARDSEWLLIGRHGNRVIRSTIRRRLEHNCRMCGIPPKSPHKIRKTYATQLIDAGVSENIIKDQMGHTDIETTKEYYYFTHQTDEIKAKQLEKAVANM